MGVQSPTYELDGPVAHLAYDDGKVNAQGPRWPATLEAQLDRVLEDDAGAVVISGRPGFLSAGLDLKALPSIGPEKLREFTEAYGAVLMRLFSFPRPVVVACTGHAIAGGAVLLLSADLKIGTRGDYKIGMSEVQVGIALPPFAALLGESSLPASSHARALLHGGLFNPEEALALGFFDELLDPEDVIPRALRHAHRLAALPRFAYETTKDVIRGHRVREAQARQGEGAFFDRIVRAWGLDT